MGATKMGKLTAEEKKFRNKRRNDFSRTIKRSKLKPASVKVVLCALLDRYNVDDDYCFPGLERIADDTGLSMGCVKKAMAVAMKEGVIKRTRRMGTSSKTEFNWEFSGVAASGSSRQLAPKVADVSPECSRQLAPKVADVSPVSGYSSAPKVARNITVEPITSDSKVVTLKESNIPVEHPNFDDEIDRILELTNNPSVTLWKSFKKTG
jgi:hypothetical protein